jgi:hypothetical protein
VPEPNDRQEDAQRALEGAARDSEAFGASSLARTARRVGNDFGGQHALGKGDAGTDPVEVWGRRVGRALSVPAALLLVWWLGHQLGWWGTLL